MNFFDRNSFFCIGIFFIFIKYGIENFVYIYYLVMVIWSFFFYEECRFELVIYFVFWFGDLGVLLMFDIFINNV